MIHTSDDVLLSSGELIITFVSLCLRRQGV